MAGPMSTESVALLLRLLPTEVVENVLACLDPPAAMQLRARIKAGGQANPDVQARLLREFFDLQRTGAPHRPEATTRPEPAGARPARAATAELPDSFRELDPALLARALMDEQPAAIAMILSRLDVPRASEVLKRLPPARRADVAVRITQPSSTDYPLLERLAVAVAEKARALADVPAEPSPEERIKTLAAMFRRLGRAERAEVLAAIEKSDPQTVQQIRQELFQFEDVLVIDDRPLQDLLVEIDLKTLATALKDASEDIQEKILRNTSSRNRQMLLDEIGLLGTISRATAQEARGAIVDVLRRFEEEGKISLES